MIVTGGVGSGARHGRTARRAAAVLVAAALSLAMPGCTKTREEDDKPSSGTIVGVIVDIEQPRPTEVESFVVSSDGRRFDFAIDPDHDYEFPLPHLREHLVGSEPVKVRYEVRDGRRVALEIDDA